MKYLGTYYYANIVQGVIENSFDYLSNLENMFSDSEILDYARPFTKKSNLHSFIEFIIDSLFWEESSKLSISRCRDRSNLDFDNPTYITPLEQVLSEYKMGIVSFMQWWKISATDQVLEDGLFEDYYNYLFSLSNYYKVVESLSEDVFYIIFLNRKLLQEFNELFSSYLQSCQDSEDAKEYIMDNGLQEVIRSDFKLHRVNIPMWVKRAVYFRDRGICVNCGRDLSGYLSLENVENFDHIVPLNLFGFNDVTNIQLLCRDCNSKKSGNRSEPITMYQSWYEK
ncbi:HNH endonuclease [Paenibacillus illinoisensis]|uniref:HNH endonuclease n=1 Tax=Paenibacillus illinoisensis TaxID=59845 RepID=A0ABW8HRB4_9BACL